MKNTMAKQEKSTKSNFIIKLSCETVQKLSEEQVLSEDKTSAASNKSDGCSNSKIEDNVDQTSDVENEQNKIEVSVTKTDTDSNNKSNDPSDDSNKSTESEDKKLSDSDSINASWGDYAPYISYEGEEAIYTDPSTHQKYIWNESTKSWTLKEGQTEVPGRVYSYENDTHIYTDTDGSKSFWDADKKAWLPKVDDDFLALYQMSYGFIDNSKDGEKDSQEKESQKKPEPSGVKRKTEPQWFEQADEKNTKVYVSNLPLDITEEEFVNLMQKCGLVERDVATHKMKIKMYMDKEHNCFKGDALCTYIKIESVDLALKLIDGSDYKGNKIKVERAQFQMKGEYNPALKPKKKKKKELEKIKKMQQKLFDWRPEKFIGERSKHERVVIIKNVFHPTDFDKEVQLILDYQQDLREECTKCGEVRKVVIYDRHPEGVAQVTMKEPEQADAVVQLINGRWFGKRQLTAEIWDGKTKYKIAETDADINKRIDKWDKFLEGKETDGNKKTSEPKPSELSVDSDIIKQTDDESDKSNVKLETTSNEPTKMEETVNHC